jgi:hypothetical protein
MSSDDLDGEVIREGQPEISRLDPVTRQWTAITRQRQTRRNRRSARG